MCVRMVGAPKMTFGSALITLSLLTAGVCFLTVFVDFMLSTVEVEVLSYRHIQSISMIFQKRKLSVVSSQACLILHGYPLQAPQNTPFRHVPLFSSKSQTAHDCPLISKKLDCNRECCKDSTHPSPF